jgi:glycosyltransferase involved in cell wall biosynthesis
MRIALLWPVYLPNISAATLRCAAFAKHLTELGGEVTVVTPLHLLGKERTEGNSYDVKRIVSFDALSRSLGFGAAVTAFPMILGNVRKSISEIHPDLVIASTPGPLLAFEGFLATRRMNIPFILDLRDPWRSGKYLHSGPTRNWSKQLIEEFLCRQSDLVLCVTPMLRDMVVSDYKIDPKNAVVVRNGAREGDEDVLDARKDYDLVFLGTPSVYKNLEKLFKALAIVSHSYPLRVLFVGWIDNAYTRSLEGLVTDLGLSESIEFQSQISPEKVRGVISRARIAVETFGGPSPIACSIGAKNYEYLAAGLPIACLSEFQKGEMHSFLTEGVGFVETESVNFAKRLISILEDPDELKRMSRNALEYSKKFSWKRIVSDVYDSHFRRLVGDST